jgi:hypothetical protein
MPERSSGDQLVWFARATLLVITSAVVYYLTWRFLTAFHLTSWLAPLWAIETGLLLVVSYFVVAHITAQRPVDRRTLSRVPAAVPVRYATEEGQVGIGTLLDITEKGAGLLVPKTGIEADRVWIQFLWFEDRIGTQGRVVYAHETTSAVRLGLELQPLHPETLNLLTDFVIPYGKAVSAGNHHGMMSSIVQRFARRPEARQSREAHLPIRVQRDTFSAWAIPEDVTEQGATLLLPGRVPEGAHVQISHCGNGRPCEYQVVRWEPLVAAPPGLSRIEVRPTTPS